MILSINVLPAFQMSLRVFKSCESLEHLVQAKSGRLENVKFCFYVAFVLISSFCGKIMFGYKLINSRDGYCSRCDK